MNFTDMDETKLSVNTMVNFHGRCSFLCSQCNCCCTLFKSPEFLKSSCCRGADLSLNMESKPQEPMKETLNERQEVMSGLAVITNKVSNQRVVHCAVIYLLTRRLRSTRLVFFRKSAIFFVTAIRRDVVSLGLLQQRQNKFFKGSRSNRSCEFKYFNILI